MRLGGLWKLVRRDLGRTRGALTTSGFGIAAGTAALVFFLALGLSMQALLARVFPLDQVELEPPPRTDPGLLGLLTGGGDAPMVPAESVESIRRVEGVKAVYPKLRISFPTGARGGKALLGRDVGASEMVGDGIDPNLVIGDLDDPEAFRDPYDEEARTCEDDEGCPAAQYCEKPNEDPGRCSDPVPVVISPYLIEIFDKSIAPAHRLPPIGKTLVSKAKHVTFQLRLGESALGKSKHGEPRTVRARLVGVSPKAIGLGLTLPISTVRRWNTEFGGSGEAEAYSSIIVQMESSGTSARVLAKATELGIQPTDTRSRDVTLLVGGVIGLLLLVAGVILLVSASNIAFTFRVLVSERRSEIALYRAIGASGADMRRWMMALALVVGVIGGAIGVGLARAMAFGLDWAAAHYLPDFPFKPDTFFSFPIWLYGLGVAFASLFAVLGAFGPARRAAKVAPAAALAGN